MTTNEELDTNIQIVKEINDDNQKSANELWIDEKTSKDSKYSDKFYQDFYPIIVKTSSQQLNKTKKICHICDTSLITLLTDSITETQNMLNKYKKIKKTSTEPLSDLSIYIKNIIYIEYQRYKQAKTQNDTNKIEDDIDKINNLAIDINNNKNNNHNQLIIFKTTNNDLLKLNDKLKSLNNLSIAIIFEKVINSLTEVRNQDKNCYLFSLQDNY